METALQTKMLHSKGAHKKTAREKRHTLAEDESPPLLFVCMTKAEMTKKGLCLKCGKHGRKADQCKAKVEASAADGIQAVHINNQEQVHSWVSN